MCIRDSLQRTAPPGSPVPEQTAHAQHGDDDDDDVDLHGWVCLLYTSDAADERSSVDLGGRRIIKKKTKNHTTGYDKEQIQKADEEWQKAKQ